VTRLESVGPVSQGSLDGTHVGSVRTPNGEYGDYSQVDVFVRETGEIAISVWWRGGVHSNGSTIKLPAVFAEDVAILLIRAGIKGGAL
jgi:hypothetical protein